MTERLITELEGLRSDDGFLACSVKRDEPMSAHTTFRIGGPASLFVTPLSVDALMKSVELVKEYGSKLFILGKGSNVLFSDKGYDGVVINTSRIDEVSVNGCELTAFAGASLTAVSRYAAGRSLSGLEFAFGIPGSVGGAVYMNAGAYGGEMAQIVIESVAFDISTSEKLVISGPDHSFGYRTSCFKSGGQLILSVKMQLLPGDGKQISDKMADLMDRRQQKQPLEYPSAGSVFKRPEGHYTGQLIEEAGLKGFSVGGASVSEKHAGFIVNRGGATAENVLELIGIIKEKIRDRFGMELECEIIYVG